MPFLHTISAMGKVLAVAKSPWLPPSALREDQVLLARRLPVGSLISEVPQYTFMSEPVFLQTAYCAIQYWKGMVTIKAVPFQAAPERVCLLLEDHETEEPIARVNIFDPDMTLFCLPHTHIWVKSYSENLGMLEWLESLGCVRDMAFDLPHNSGFPAVRLPAEWLSRLGISA